LTTLHVVPIFFAYTSYWYALWKLATQNVPPWAYYALVEQQIDLCCYRWSARFLSGSTVLNAMYL